MLRNVAGPHVQLTGVRVRLADRDEEGSGRRLRLKACCYFGSHVGPV